MELSGQRQARPGCFAFWNRASGSHSIRGLAGPRASLNASENETHLLPLPEMEPRLLGYPVRSTVSISAPDGHSTDSLFSDWLRTSLVFRTNRFRSLRSPPILKQRTNRDLSAYQQSEAFRTANPPQIVTASTLQTMDNAQHTPNTVRPMNIWFHKTGCIRVILKVRSEELHNLKSSDIFDHVLWPTSILKQLFLTRDPGRWPAQPLPALKNIFQYNIKNVDTIYIYIYIYKTIEIKTRRLSVHVTEMLQSQVYALLRVSKLGRLRQLRNHVYVTHLLQTPDKIKLQRFRLR